MSKWGWLPDRPDMRDYRFAPSRAALRVPDSRFDLRDRYRFSVWDQGRIGSCTAQAAAYCFMAARDAGRYAGDWPPSRLFVYYYSRVKINMPTVDSGAYLRDTFSVLRERGAPPESYWPYSDEPANPITEIWPKTAKAGKAPGARALAEGAKHQAIEYLRVQQTVQDIKAAIASGFPVAFGFTVYNTLYDRNGTPHYRIPLPRASDFPLGGHAVSLCGWDDAESSFALRNSWGPGVGEGGYQLIPYAYVTNPYLASDFWCLRSVENRVPGIS